MGGARLVALVAAMSLVGCSFAFVRKPSSNLYEPVDCTDSPAIPIVDVIGAAASLAVTIYEASEIKRQDYACPGCGVILIPVVLLPASLITAYGLSAAVGFYRVGRCRSAEESALAMGRPVGPAATDIRRMIEQAEAAAERSDCAAVLAIGEDIKQRDEGAYAKDFARNVAIARCLPARD